MKNQKNIAKLIDLREETKLGGGEKAIQRQHDKGKLTARERIDLLLDKGSFEEYDMFITHRCTNFGMEKKKIKGDGVVSGKGTINGRLTYIFAQDFTVLGGSLSETMSLKICKIMDEAMRVGAPVIGLNDSGGARIQEGVGSLGGFGEIFQRNINASGVIPQISAILGPCAGGAVYSPALTDFIMMTTTNANMFLTGPKVVKQVTGEDISADALGGGAVHSSKSGVSHFLAENEEELLEDLKTLLSFLPQNNMENPPRVTTNDDPARLSDKLNEIIPEEATLPFDMYEVIEEIVDDAHFLEIHKNYAQNIIVGFARLDGQSVGIVANQPKVLAGVLDVNASRKAARFVRFCDSFNIPILTLVDVPGFLPGSGQEHNAVIVHGAKLLYAYGEATVPKITVTLRKSYGGAHIVMSCKQMGGDVNYAWPSSEIAVMGSGGAVEILYGKVIQSAETEEEAVKLTAEKKEEYEEKFSNPYQAASLGYIDDVIEPRNTRFRVIRALKTLHNKRVATPTKKHSNEPL